MTDYSLYGAPVSLFSGKARAYLRWKGVEFDEVLTSTDVMRELLPIIGWPVIPVLRTSNGDWVQDTGDIIARVEADHPSPSVRPSGGVQRFISELLHVYGDEWLTLPAMHYRWNYNEAWTFKQFGALAAPDADLETQLKIGQKRGKMFKGFVPMLGINEQTIPAIERSYETFLDELSAHLSEHPFLLGGRPSLADISFYGPLYAHLYRDPESGKIMKFRAPKVAEWVERLLTGDYEAGDLIGGDAIPDTLLPLLSRHFAEHLPVLEQTNKLLCTWAAGQTKGAEVPRALGMADFQIGEIKGQIIARTFSLYRLQAAMDVYAELSDAEREAADAMLDATGGAALKRFEMGARLGRENYKLVLGELV